MATAPQVSTQKRILGRANECVFLRKQLHSFLFATEVYDHELFYADSLYARSIILYEESPTMYTFVNEKMHDYALLIISLQLEFKICSSVLARHFY